MLIPGVLMVSTTAFWVLPDRSCLKLTRNRIVMSMAMPRAILNTITVDGLSLTPAQPMIPAVTINGMIFGISEQRRILTDRNNISIQAAIRRKDHWILSFKPFITKALPSRYVTLVPVNSTLYFDESNKAPAFRRNSSSTTGNR